MASSKKNDGANKPLENKNDAPKVVANIQGWAAIGPAGATACAILAGWTVVNVTTLLAFSEHGLIALDPYFIWYFLGSYLVGTSFSYFLFWLFTKHSNPKQRPSKLGIDPMS